MTIPPFAGGASPPAVKTARCHMGEQRSMPGGAGAQGFVTCLAALLVFLGLGWTVKPYVEELRDLARLDSTDANEAQAAARRLAKAGSRRATERLVKLLGRASKEQTWVSEALRERLPGALPILAAELENEWEAGDLEVVRFPEELEEDARPVAPSFVKALERLDEEESVLSVSFALLEIDPNAHELVRPLLRSPVRAARLNALGIFQMADTVPASRVPDVAALLEDEDATVRSDAAWTLSRLRPDAVTARAALVPRLIDRDPGGLGDPRADPHAGGSERLVRSRAILALAAVGGPALSAGEALAHAALHDDNAYNRVWAGYALGRLGAHQDIAVQALVRELKDGPTEELRERAAEYLGRLGSAGRGAIPHLEAALRSRHARVRMAAVAALGRLREVSRIPAKVDTHSEAKPDGDSGGSGTAVSEEAEQGQRDADGVKEQQDPPG